MNDESTSSFKSGQAKLAEDVQTVLSDAQELLKLAAGEAGQGYKDARARLERSVQAARQQLETMQDNAMQSAREAGRSAEGYVREHPWEAIGIGAGLGLLLGVLISRR
jgi:ElaB/YqjD/DUF883 family membrane-anchored ribosome-binding protein